MSAPTEHESDEQLARRLSMDPDVRRLCKVLNEVFTYPQDDANAFTWLCVDADCILEFHRDGRTVAEALADTGLLCDGYDQTNAIAAIEKALVAR